jgi:hypothetical protein
MLHNSASSVRINARMAGFAWSQQFRPGDLDRVVQRIRHALVGQSVRMAVEP